MLKLPTCRDMSELASDYLERALPLQTWIGARGHLVLCPACRRYYAQMRQTIRLLAACGSPPPASEVEARVSARLRDAAEGTP
jgi:predicted anti-sigma-YlaC factor YlaD